MWALSSDSFWWALKQQFIYPNFRFIFKLYLDGSVPTLGLKSDFKYFDIFNFHLKLLTVSKSVQFLAWNFSSNSQNFFRSQSFLNFFISKIGVFGFTDQIVYPRPKKSRNLELHRSRTETSSEPADNLKPWTESAQNIRIRGSSGHRNSRRPLFLKPSFPSIK